MIRSKHLRVGAAAGTVVISLVALAGCSGKTSVSGKVTFDGKSVDDRGVISFRPVGQGRPVAGEIKGGMYYLDVDKGLTAGTYKVEVYWKQKGKEVRSSDPPNKQYQMNEIIPRKYNTETTLMADIKPGSNSKDFDLPK